MKNFKRKKIIVILSMIVVFAATLIISTDSSLAYAKTPDTYIIYIGGNFHNEGVEKVLTRINEIRKEACDSGINGLTKDDYVPIKWSREMELIAQQRAAEASLYPNHTRPDGTSCFSIKQDGYTHNGGEILAWNYAPNILSGVESWYEEKKDLLNNTGEETGHYKAMIDPNNKYVGLAAFEAGSFKPEFPVCQAGAFSTNKTISEDKSNIHGITSVRISVKSSYVKEIVIPDKLTIIIKKPLYIVPVAKLNVPSFSFINHIPALIEAYNEIEYNKNVVSVDNNGKITAHKAGPTEIKLTLLDGTQKVISLNVVAMKNIKIKGLSLKNNQYSTKGNLVDKIYLSSKLKRTVYLYRYYNGKWHYVKKFKSNSKGVCYIKYPSTWKKYKNTKWRIKIKPYKNYYGYTSKTISVNKLRRQKTTVKSLSRKISAKKYKRQLKDKIYLNTKFRRTVYLYRYYNGKWHYVKKFKTNSKGGCYMKYPSTWKKYKKTRWRIKVKAYKKYGGYASKSIYIYRK